MWFNLRASVWPREMQQKMHQSSLCAFSLLSPLLSARSDVQVRMTSAKQLGNEYSEVVPCGVADHSDGDAGDDDLFVFHAVGNHRDEKR